MSDVQLVDDFKQAMRRQCSTIALVTASDGDDWIGIAATAVLSVCAVPPTLLIAVSHTSLIHAVLRTKSGFCVNLLSDRHRDLVEPFSGGRSGMERFAAGNWMTGAHGLPVLADALASLICETTTRLDVGTHTLFIGRVEEVAVRDAIDPLLWIDGGLAVASR